MTDNTKKILIIDDAIFFRGILEKLLAETGYTVLTANNGDEALEIFKNNRNDLDLVILDLLVSGKPGIEIIEELRANQSAKELKMFVLSGIYNTEWKHNIFEKYNLSGYLNKSTPPEEIIFAINRLLYPEDKNTRGSERAPISLLIEYRINDSVFNGYLYTISEGGLFIRTTNIKPVGTELDLAFHLPGMEEITIAKGIIVHVRVLKNGDPSNIHPPGMGVKFISISPIDLDSIKNYVKKKSLEDSGKFKAK